MTNVDGNLVVAILQRLQCDMSDLRHDMNDVKVRLTIVDGHIGSLVVSQQLADERLDRLQSDMSQSKRRLDLVDVP